MSPGEEQIVRDNMRVFQKSGFDFKEDENGNISLSAAPHCKGMTFGSEDIMEMIGQLERGERSLWHLQKSFEGGDGESGFSIHPPRFRALLASKACRSSIMIGKPLTRQKMLEILNNLSTLVSPWNCPHGRPTMRHLAHIK